VATRSRVKRPQKKSDQTGLQQTVDVAPVTLYISICGRKLPQTVAQRRADADVTLEHRRAGRHDFRWLRAPAAPGSGCTSHRPAGHHNSGRFHQVQVHGHGHPSEHVPPNGHHAGPRASRVSVTAIDLAKISLIDPRPVATPRASPPDRDTPGIPARPQHPGHLRPTTTPAGIPARPQHLRAFPPDCKHHGQAAHPCVTNPLRPLELPEELNEE
jgi:hypothetical protein